VLGVRANVNTVLFTFGICASRPACFEGSSSTPPTASSPAIPPSAEAKRQPELTLDIADLDAQWKTSLRNVVYGKRAL
jgi:hypothetical protein